MGEMFDGHAYARMINARQSSSQPMVAQFLNAARKSKETLEDLSKQELLQAQNKTARKSLAYDDMQPPSLGRPQKFTPPRRATQLISASPDDFEFEADSMTSQSSRTARTRLTEKFEVVRIFSKKEFTEERINKFIEDHAKAEMAKAGQLEDLLGRATNIGGFKQVNVCGIICLRTRMIGSHIFDICFADLPS